MKKILGLAAGVLLSFASMAQSVVSFTNSTEGYNKATTQTFNFTFEQHTLDQINSAGAYYTSYFTVTPTAADGKVNVAITLVEDNEMNRRIIGRFFTSLEVESLKVGAAEMHLPEFMDAYVML